MVPAPPGVVMGALQTLVRNAERAPKLKAAPTRSKGAARGIIKAGAYPALRFL